RHLRPVHPLAGWVRSAGAWRGARRAGKGQSPGAVDPGRKVMSSEDFYNQFQLTGYGGQITYSLSSVAGPPLFHYQDQEFDQQASGDDIRRQEMEIGILVSITLEVIPDLRTVTATVLLPPINRDGDTVTFETGAVIATRRENIAGPSAI